MPAVDHVILKRFEAPDEVRQFEKGRFEIVRLGGLTRCTVEHVGMVVSGSATAAFDDGRVIELRAGHLALVLDVRTPLGFRVTCSADRWNLIAGKKHPAMTGRLDVVAATLRAPDEIRRSSKDPEVVLFHRRSEGRWVCAVPRYNLPVSVLITAYPADSIKRGELVWTS